MHSRHSVKVMLYCYGRRTKNCSWESYVCDGCHGSTATIVSLLSTYQPKTHTNSTQYFLHHLHGKWELKKSKKIYLVQRHNKKHPMIDLMIDSLRLALSYHGQIQEYPGPDIPARAPWANYNNRPSPLLLFKNTNSDYVLIRFIV